MRKAGVLKVGITGGIGSGKTTVCKIFQVLGVPVFYADEEAKKMYEIPIIRKKIVKLFGKKILDKHHRIDKKKLSTVVFADPAQLAQLNAIIHPQVQNRFRQWLQQHKKKRYVIKEAAILIESGAYREMDYIILVKTPRKVIFSRLAKTGKFSLAEIRKRMQHQFSDREREKCCHAVILNDGRKGLLPQVWQIHDKLSSWI